MAIAVGSGSIEHARRHPSNARRLLVVIPLMLVVIPLMLVAIPLMIVVVPLMLERAL